MTVLSTLPIENIRHRPDARHRSDEALAALADSLAEIGLISPIRVRKVGDDEYEVVAGSHRLQAAELLGWHEIVAIVSDDDDLHAELAMIDENLVRAELSPSDRAQQTARRKAIFLELHPETGHGANLEGAGVAKLASPESPTFARATANVTGLSERAVQRDAERGEKVTSEAFDAIRGTALDTGTYLDRLKRVAQADQVATAQRDLAAPRPTRPLGGIGARYAAPSVPPVPPGREAFNHFIRLADDLEALRAADLIAGSGRQRAVLGQRASSLADFMSSIMEGLSQ